LKVDPVRCQDFEQALSLEWLETNGRGGYASGTVAGANTRRYHALLLVARHPPVDRVVLVNHLEEWIEAGEHSFPISTNLYRGAVYPDGYRLCEGFSPNPWPTWRYGGYGIQVERELFCPYGRDMVVIRWRLVGQGSSGIFLRVRPMLSGRDYHATHHENAELQSHATIEQRQVTWQPYVGLPAVHAFHNGH
jgi:predicted glycogen debranching enzyme